MTRAIAQSMIAVMMFFAVMTLILKGVVYLRLGYKRRGIMYFGISIIAGFFAVLSFYFALGEIKAF